MVENLPIKVRAHAKVNLCLYVGAPRHDNLHPLVSVVAPISLYDDVELSVADGSEDMVECAGVGQSNLALAALRSYREASGYFGSPIKITIVKRIPIAAGLGGGSADAAAVLRVLDQQIGLVSESSLHQIACSLGADVPVQFSQRRSLMTGAGETLLPLPADRSTKFVIVPASEPLSTAAVYREFDRLGKSRTGEELTELATEIERQKLLPAGLEHNDLQSAALSLLPSIADRLQLMSDSGADSTLVSGSGPTVFGVFEGADDSELRAKAAAETISQHGHHAIVTSPLVP